ncbi:Hypothetical protein NTJ_12028 [Nesidiocoris tenuis]|uniref:MBD domain-containing protein n=1 Tax=Nesidiocoris tenuis TaxID=355587 RepID=A0ABN7B7R8_9HEMI|nr:Hypothetical protein NTJ_12028 [Nesidiocoris tenuis]
MDETSETNVAEKPSENSELASQCDDSPDKPEASKAPDHENPVAEKESPSGMDLNGNQKTDKPTVEVHPMVVKTPDNKRKFVDDSPPSSSKKGHVVPQDNYVPITDDSPLMLPFKLGWSRELVYRSIQSSTKADAYYRAPNGKKLRSMVEIERFLNADDVLTRENFSFNRHPLGLNDPAKEMVRSAFNSARPDSGASPARKPKKKPARRKSAGSPKKPIDKLVISNIKKPEATFVRSAPMTIKIAAPKKPVAIAPKMPVPPKPGVKKPSPPSSKLRLNLPALFSGPDKSQQQRIAVVPSKAIKPMPLSKKMEALKAASQSAKQRPTAPNPGATKVPKIQVKPTAQLVQPALATAQGNVKIPQVRLIPTFLHVEQPVIHVPNIQPNAACGVNYSKAYDRWVGYPNNAGHLNPTGRCVNTPTGPLKPIQNKSTIRVAAPNFLLQPTFPVVESAQKRINYMLPIPSPKMPKATNGNPELIVCEPELPNYTEIMTETDERADRKFSDFLAGKIVSPVSKSSLAIPGFPEFKRIKLVRRREDLYPSRLIAWPLIGRNIFREPRKDSFIYFVNMEVKLMNHNH